MSARRWPSPAIKALSDLWPHFSASQVADILTRVHGHACTKNAVIGKVHRLRESGTPGLERKERV